MWCRTQTAWPLSHFLVTFWFPSLVAFVLPSFLWASEPELKLNSPQIVADLLDEQMHAVWRNSNIVPAPLANDSEFLRRVFLHLNGTIPDVYTVRNFLVDNSPEKRQRQIDQCLDGPAYCTNFAKILRDVLLPDPGADFLSRLDAHGFEAWLARQFAQDVPYDRIVLQMLVRDVSGNEQDRSPYSSSALSENQINSIAFYRLRQAVPENLAAAATRHFLGVRIECAQCHDHPFDHWTQEQFWSIAAFFSGQSAQAESGQVTFRIKIPNTDKFASAAFLEDSPSGWPAGTDSRRTIAEWITGPTNRRFAEATVNRLWAHLFGRGLVEPVDDFHDLNPASHPEVLSLLADELVKHNYDLKFLLRAITYSKTYQRSSRRTDSSQDAPEMFARMQTQGLTSSQLLRSIMQAAGTEPEFERQFAESGGLFGPSNPAFSSLFPNSNGSSLERESSILQSLVLMNGQLISQAVSRHSPSTLAAVIGSPFLNNDQKIDTLFLATYSRFPTPQERERVQAFLDSSRYQPSIVPFVKFPVGDKSQGFSELLWAMLNSSEFCLNH